MRNYLFPVLILVFSIKSTKPETFYPNCTYKETFCIDNKTCIGLELICNKKEDCMDGSDEATCQYDRSYISEDRKLYHIQRDYYYSCSNVYIKCKSNKKCIPKNWICDGQVDCGDGSDERQCVQERLRFEDIPGINESREKGIAWIYKQRRANWGWGKDSSRAIVLLRLSDDKNFNLTNVMFQIMDKQMKLHIVENFFRNNRSFENSYEVASYVHSLLATCSNPKKFQGFNLVRILEEKMEQTEPINPMVALAICNGNGSISSKQILQLKGIVSDEKRPFLIDFQPYALMALACLKQKNASNPLKLILKNETSFLNFQNATQKFTTLQKKDGSYGNIYTTALMMHMFLSMRSLNVTKSHWDAKKAFRYLIFQQRNDGSFGDMLSTYLVLPLMNRKTLFDLGKINCSIQNPDLTINSTVEEELNSGKVNKHRVKYFVFVGKDNDVSFDLTLNVPVNSTFYDVMRLAAELDSRFIFKYIQYPWGKYVYSIFGIVNNPESRNYWRLYKSIENSHSLNMQQSPDKEIPEDNTKYIYWYKMIQL